MFTRFRVRRIVGIHRLFAQCKFTSRIQRLISLNCTSKALFFILNFDFIQMEFLFFSSFLLNHFSLFCEDFSSFVNKKQTWNKELVPIFFLQKANRNCDYQKKNTVNNIFWLQTVTILRRRK